MGRGPGAGVSLSPRRARDARYSRDVY